ncbi:MAG: FprA family A-type flavoprotein [Candidatus Hodarchaeota archaeon]
MTSEKVEITKGVYWVGAIDWMLRDFHGLWTPKGGTYNAYLILDEKITLIDTVAPNFTNELLDRIRTIVDPAKIDYIICQHVEPDHSTTYADMIKVAPKATIITSKRGAEFLKLNYPGVEFPLQIVEDGETLSLGKRNLKFVQIPMVHWPETMVSYMPEDQLLFSNDAFGMQIATPYRFADQVDDWYEPLRAYYSYIVRWNARAVLNAFKKFEGVPVKIIAPSHGPIWRKDIEKIMEIYYRWSSSPETEHAIVVYSTIWQSTKQMAYAIREGISSVGVAADLYNLEDEVFSRVQGAAMEAKAVVVGAMTYNIDPYYPTAAFMPYLKHLRPENKIGAAFGSYGWGGGATKVLTEQLKEYKFGEVLEPLNVQFRPNQEDLQRCFEYGQEIGRKVKAAFK